MYYEHSQKKGNSLKGFKTFKKQVELIIYF